MTSAPSTKDRLRAAGLRVTGPRTAVLEVLAQASDHPDADEVRRRARQALGSVSTQAVYDVLEALAAAGLARRIEPAGGPARFEARAGDNHHHLVCRACRRVVDVDCAVGRAPCLDPGGDAGFAVEEAEVLYWGVCRSCRRTAEPA